MNKKLILIDDEQMILESMSSILSMKYNVKCFDNPKQALEYLSNPENKPDCIVCDVNMPGMSGIELMKKYRELESQPWCKFIFFTGHGDFVTELQGLKEEYAIDEVCIKPDFTIIKKINDLIS